MITDFHTHANYADGESSATEMIESAISKGLKVIGFSEHHPRHPDFRYAGDPPGEIRGFANWSEYIAEIDSLKKKYSNKIEILKGSEFDWLSVDHLDEWRKWRAETDWDFVIGSVHFLGKWGFDYLADWEPGRRDFASIEEIYRKYYSTVVEMVESANDLFEIVGHLDLIKKFVDDVPKNATELAFPALDAIAKTDLVVEINSAGWTKKCAEQYPSAGILRALREREIPITLDSDAHSADRVAENFERSKKLAKDAGFNSITIFHQKGAREIIKI